MEEYTLTDEQWEEFKKASPHFKSAKQEYIRNVPRFLTEQVINIYESATGKTILNKDLSCAICVLRVYQTAGKLYFSELSRREKLEENKDGKKRNEELYSGNSEKKKRNSSKSSRRVEQK